MSSLGIDLRLDGTATLGKFQAAAVPVSLPQVESATPIFDRRRKPSMVLVNLFDGGRVSLAAVEIRGGAIVHNQGEKFTSLREYFLRNTVCDFDVLIVSPAVNRGGLFASRVGNFPGNGTERINKIDVAIDPKDSGNIARRVTLGAEIYTAFFLVGPYKATETGPKTSSITEFLTRTQAQALVPEAIHIHDGESSILVISPASL
jgi:hypothetical protein